MSASHYWEGCSQPRTHTHTHTHTQPCSKTHIATDIYCNAPHLNFLPSMGWLFQMWREGCGGKEARERERERERERKKKERRKAHFSYKCMWTMERIKNAPFPSASQAKQPAESVWHGASIVGFPCRPPPLMDCILPGPCAKPSSSAQTLLLLQVYSVLQPGLILAALLTVLFRMWCPWRGPFILRSPSFFWRMRDGTEPDASV